MRVFTTFLFAVSALAYQVTYPTETQGWGTSGTNLLSWVRVDTDPLNFAAILTNQNMGYSQILDSLVDGTAGSINLNAPSGGWPTGSAFRVNLAQDAQHPDSLLAQSPQFNITSSGSSGSSGSPGSTSTGTATSSRSGSSTASGASSTSSSTSTSPTSTSAGLLSVDARAGLLTAVVALTALVTTLF